MNKIQNNINTIKPKIAITKQEEELINKAIRKMVNIIKKPDLFYKTFMEVKSDNRDLPIALTYADVCMLISEIMEFNNDYKWEEIAHEYIVRIRDDLYKLNTIDMTSTFGGLIGVGYGIYAIYKKTLSYKKFLTSLNHMIVDAVEIKLKLLKNCYGNMRMEYYDAINGLSGTLGYLLLFKEDKYVEDSIKGILKFLVKITEDIEVLGYKVPGWYIPSKNQFLNVDKVKYKNGNFNMGLSHGITGPLAAMSISLKEGIEVKGQILSMEKILNELKRFHYEDENGDMYWSGRISYEEYINSIIKCDENRRSSWCYGTPGIARSMYMAGSILGENESINMAIKAIEGICKMGDEKLGLHSPIFCHGYAGLLSVIQAMYLDVHNELFNIEIRKLFKKILYYYDENSILGFYNIEFKDVMNNNFELVNINSVSLIEGAIGVILSLIYIMKPEKKDCMRIFMLN